MAPALVVATTMSAHAIVHQFTDAKTLAGLVTNVTEPMFGMRFVSSEGHERGASICASMVLLPIPGKRPIDLVLASDHRGARALAGGLFGCAPHDLTQEMINDAVSELLNMVAGQVQGWLRLDQALGLPRPTSLGEILGRPGARLDQSVLLRSEGSVDLKLWIFESSPG